MRYLLTSLLCVFTLSLTAQVDCPNTYDGDEDGAIGISDLLGLLSLFGDADTDSDGVWDSEDECIDQTACNYQSNPTNLCYYLDVVGVCGGLCIEDADGDGVCDFDCGDQVGHEGYNYSTVQIGEQCWFAENCRYLPSITQIQNEVGNYETSLSIPFYYVYDYEGTDVLEAMATESYETYGVLYNGPAVMTEEICPNGWHMPSSGEWTQLTNFLGADSASCIGCADAMKSTTGWPNWVGGEIGYTYDAGGSNSSGFTALPGGYWGPGGGSYGGHEGTWWSSTWYGSQRWSFHIENNSVQPGWEYSRHSGLSARCIRG